MTNTPPLLASLAEAKAYARSLRRDMASTGDHITHARALEITAERMGYKDWNTLSARLGPSQTFHPMLGDKLRGIYLKQPFIGRLIALSERNGGAYFQVAIQLDEPIDVVQFESFSAFRTRLNATLDKRGQSPSRTSDGEPQMVILETFSDLV